LIICAKVLYYEKTRKIPNPKADVNLTRERLALNDAQISGGLLIALARDKVKVFLEECAKHKDDCAVEIGEVIEGKPRLNVK